MDNVTIITGPIAAGKTTLAVSLNQNYYFHIPKNSNNQLPNRYEFIELLNRGVSIIFDNIDSTEQNKKGMRELIEIYNKPRPNKYWQENKRLPDIFFIIQTQFHYNWKFSGARTILIEFFTLSSF